MSEANAYAVVVSFISIIIILSIAMIIMQEEDALKQENSTNITPSLVTKIRCVNCMQYQDAERQQCVDECARQLK
jgi:hypothetical protein